jgi:uncharacterized integral membrane protein
MTFRKILAIVLLLMLAVFVLMNLDPTQVWLFVTWTRMPLALVILLSAALGFAAGELTAFFRQRKPVRAAKPVEAKPK